MIQTQFNKKVKMIRTENGEEFTCLSSYYQTSIVGTPQQNGKVERKHRHILNVVRALRFQAKFTCEFLGRMYSSGWYLMNRTPSNFLMEKDLLKNSMVKHHPILIFELLVVCAMAIKRCRIILA